MLVEKDSWKFSFRDQIKAILKNAIETSIKYNGTKHMIYFKSCQTI